MHRTRLLGIGMILTLALAALAQQTGNVQGGTHRHEMPSVEDHLKTLSGKLDLTADQQTKIRPALQEMHDSMQKLMQNQSLSPQEKHARHQELFETADRKTRKFLNDDQKKKLDEMEQQSGMR